jgi:hypothetical protein
VNIGGGDFAELQPKTLTLKNEGNELSDTINIVVTGDTDLYTVNAVDCDAKTLDSNEECDVIVTAKDPGIETDEDIRITATAGTVTKFVDVTGTFTTSPTPSPSPGP